VFFRFVICNFIALLWAGASYRLAGAWIDDLGAVIGMIPAQAVVLLIAILPGYLNALLLMSLLTYKERPLDLGRALPPLSVLIAAYNEEATIAETLRGLRSQVYPAEMEIIIVDDGSSDRTIAVARENTVPGLRIIAADHGGKANALNRALAASLHETIVTIDADTFLHRGALERIVARLHSDPRYAAVAGHVLAKNDRRSRLARLQTWDYMLAISSVKRQQGLFRGTLVAQGAFSAFRKSCLERVGRWEDRIGEDIVLTWALLNRGYRVGFEPTAIAFTNVPLRLREFSRQRQRWARGMIEGFKSHISIIWRRRGYSSFFVALDLLFPVIDFVYTFIFIPGLILACFGKRYIAGPYTLLLLPLTLLLVMVMYVYQKKILNKAGIKIRRNPWGLVGYILFYQFIMSPVCVLGYTKEVLGWRRRW
jgi:poly-beta-1,6-N-acetyl-D-glucosamine synthase